MRRSGDLELGGPAHGERCAAARAPKRSALPEAGPPERRIVQRRRPAAPLATGTAAEHTSPPSTAECVGSTVPAAEPALSGLSSVGSISSVLSPFPAQTLYNVRAEILPPAGTELCRTGALCALEVAITRLSDLLEVDRDEALTESDEHFSTKLMYEGGFGARFPQALR